MNKLTITDEQLTLINQALDFYFRVGTGQFDVIKNHPTFEKHLHNEFKTKEGKLEIGDKTVRGIITDIDPKGKWIKTKSYWGNGEEIKKWLDLQNIHHTTDYEQFHITRDEVDTILNQARNLLYNSDTLNKNGSWGIHHPNVDNSCREAFDMLQVIRHEKWKINENRSKITVDSHIHFTSTNNDSNKIKCELNIK